MLENAGRYSPTGATIVVRAWTESDGAHFMVRDHGPGLDPSDSITCSSRSIAARRRDTPPEQVSGLRSRAGCWRQKAAGFGARTCLVAAPVHDHGPITSPGPGRAGAVVMPSRVLIVDDEPSILATMAPLLRSRGYEVSTAMSGKAVPGER